MVRCVSPKGRQHASGRWSRRGAGVPVWGERVGEGIGDGVVERCQVELEHPAVQEHLSAEGLVGTPCAAGSSVARGVLGAEPRGLWAEGAGPNEGRRWERSASAAGPRVRSGVRPRACSGVRPRACSGVTLPRVTTMLGRRADGRRLVTRCPKRSMNAMKRRGDHGDWVARSTSGWCRTREQDDE